MRISRLAYRLLLLAFPPDVRREFGDDMAAMFANQVDNARPRRGRMARLWILAIADALFHGASERFGANGPPGWRWRSFMRAISQDIKYGFRMFARQPGVTFIVVMTLALGIGANTAIFSILNGFFRPLPVANPEHLVVIESMKPDDQTGLRYEFSFPDNED